MPALTCQRLSTSMLNAYAVKEWPTAKGVRVCVTRRACLTNNIALLRLESGLDR